MSISYSLLFEKNDSTLDVIKQLEKIVNSPFQFADYWEYFDLYYAEVIGLRLSLHNRNNPFKERYKRNNPNHVDEFAKYNYKVDIEHIGELIDVSNGKQWVRYAIVEIARMINRNMKCDCIVFRDDVITYSFITQKDGSVKIESNGWI